MRRTIDKRLVAVADPLVIEFITGAADRNAIRREGRDPAGQPLGDRLSRSGVKGRFQLHAQLIAKALLEFSVIAGTVVEYPLDRLGQRRVIVKDVLHMGEKGLPIVGRAIADRYRIDHDPLTGQTQNAGFMSPDHLGRRFDDRARPRIAQHPIVATRWMIRATTRFGQLGLGFFLRVAVFVLVFNGLKTRVGQIMRRITHQLVFGFDHPIAQVLTDLQALDPIP